MKRAAILFAILCAAFWTSCGGGSSNNAQVSNLKDRALFDNAVTGGVNILNIDKTPPQIYLTTVAALSAPQTMYIAPDRSFVLIYDDLSFSLNYFASAQETVTSSLPLNYHTDGGVLSADGKHAYFPIPQNPEANPTPPGAVLTFDLTTGTAGVQIPVAGARRVALSSDNNSLLVFADDTDSLWYVDLSATTIKAKEITGFNRPYMAYFGSDNKTAYVLNCGTECSGAAAPSVQPLAVSPSAQTPGTAIPVPGATVGLLNGSTLSIAGNDLTKPEGSQGVYSTVDVSGGTVSGITAIPDGLHTLMTAFNSAIFVGSKNCSTTNCLAVINSGKATIPTSTGNVTAITPAPKKNWVYVMQGGELLQFDPSGTYGMPYDIIGDGWDIKLLDQ
ncbi:hypothetical protein Acid345_3371 [Candidatus Koribacter versatilis Ellin345]|uniref:Lipoprotein n=1 Tax=Koribacter versatilis (strain Ellin345) TaxID=204669 RepID=Q1IL78_KORVE|nr:hypothetical protein [Candidatus Koribacter versatilis]ABF42372.1 hypothetical protein Acid345_3371 [Candidatus Koribacter versatilis Ellin345]